jgi:hypothetical protein
VTVERPVDTDPERARAAMEAGHLRLRTRADLPDGLASFEEGVGSAATTTRPVRRASSSTRALPSLASGQSASTRRSRPTRRPSGVDYSHSV